MTETSVQPTRVGRYAIFDEIAQGGMATIHLARLAGPVGFSRVVAVKRLHPHLLEDAEFTKMFLQEARLAARIRHPNVVPILDVLSHDGEIIIVMEYVHGESLLALYRTAHHTQAGVPLPVAAALMANVLQGLHAAHEAKNERGEPLGIVHRDVSPHNVLVGIDGVPRLLDFGVAKAAQARRDSDPGTLKGKCSYMAPEVLRGEVPTRRADVFAAATVFWELVVGTKLFGGANETERMAKILQEDYPLPSTLVPNLPPAVDEIVMRGLHPDASARYATALEMAVDLENHLPLASQRVVGEWVAELAAASLAKRAEIMHHVEVSQIGSLPPPSAPTTAPTTHGGVEVTRSDVNAYGVGLSVGPPKRSRLGLVAGAAALLIATAGFLLRDRFAAVRGATSTASRALPAEPPAATAPAPPTSARDTPADSSAKPASLPPPDPAETGPKIVVGKPRPPQPKRPPRTGGNAKDYLPSDL
jgi:serine/threonine protein kinase